jgi:hypothetical protein
VLDRTKQGWTGFQGWTWVNWGGLRWTMSDRIGHSWTGFGRVGQAYRVGLGRTGLDWGRLGRTG